jgi:hypothetical protein
MLNRAEISSITTLGFQKSPARRMIASLVTLLSWTFLFTAVYAQSPLYTSNQNQYFLHGLARAGFGYLENDWLANTLDPTPLFSWLVAGTYQIFQTGFPFYLYYAFLLGIYLFSLFGLGETRLGLKQPIPRLVYLTSLIVLHSAAIRFFLSRAFGPEWTYVVEGGLAGQRALGVVFQPSTFGVLLILSIFLFVKGKPFIAVLPLALAVNVHPTYLLTGALVTIAFMVEVFLESRNPVKSAALGLAALLLVSPILLYVNDAFGSTPPETTARARDILVHFRIPHHAVIAEWFDVTSIVQIAVMLAAMVVVRGRQLFPILAIPFSGAALLTLLQTILQVEALALLFPWRISAILVPISVAVLVASLVNWGFERFPSLNNGHRTGIRTACTLSILLVAFVGVTRMVLERQMIGSSEEREVMRYVEVEKGPAEVYLVPIKMQDFRLVTGAPIYVDFKSIPYRDAEVIEWHHRIQLATDFYEGAILDCSLLEKFTSEGVTHVLLDREDFKEPCDKLHREYEDEHYAVFLITQ